MAKMKAEGMLFKELRKREVARHNNKVRNDSKYMTTEKTIDNTRVQCTLNEALIKVAMLHEHYSEAKQEENDIKISKALALEISKISNAEVNDC